MFNECEVMYEMFRILNCGFEMFNEVNLCIFF